MKTKLFFILSAALILSACAQSGPSNNLNVEMTDFAFTPNQYSVPAGGQIMLQARHDGTVEHDFIIMNYGADVGGHFNEEDQPNVHWQIKVQPGETQTVTFTAPSQPGTYQIVCGMAGHVEAGMIGVLDVVDSQ